MSRLNGIPFRCTLNKRDRRLLNLIPISEPTNHFKYRIKERYGVYTAGTLKGMLLKASGKLVDGIIVVYDWKNHQLITIA